MPVYASTGNHYKIIVRLTETYPSPGRIWINVYDPNAGWFGWKNIHEIDDRNYHLPIGTYILNYNQKSSGINISYGSWECKGSTIITMTDGSQQTLYLWLRVS